MTDEFQQYFDAENSESWSVWSQNLLDKNQLTSLTYGESDGTVVVRVADWKLGSFLKLCYRPERIIVKEVKTSPLSSGSDRVAVKTFFGINRVNIVIPEKRVMKLSEKRWEDLTDHKRAVSISYAATQIMSKFLGPAVDLREAYFKNYESLMGTTPSAF